MRKTFKILFYLKRSALLRNGTAPILCRITISGQRTQISTQLSIAPSSWDVEQSRAIGRSAEMIRINRELDALYDRIEQCYLELAQTAPVVTPEMIRDRIYEGDRNRETILGYFARHNASFLRQVGVDRSRSTYYKYHSVEVHLCRFIPLFCGRKDLYLCELNREFLSAFHGYLLRVAAKRKNTVWVYLTALKHVLTQARHRGYTLPDLFVDYKLRSEYVHRNFLTTEELTRLIDLDHLLPAKQLIRDSFLFSCFTGLSFIDIKQLRPANIQTIGRQHWVKTTRRKTGAEVQVRLFELPTAILRKYMPINHVDAIFPLPSNSWCNHCLDELMKQAGIAKRITFHAARHTFATTLTLSQGIPIETIAKLLGHRNIRTTQIYATVTHDYLDSEMNRLSKRIDPLGARWRA